jgi:hypothetical protein
VRHEDLAALAQRDWAALEALDGAWWAERRHALGAGEMVRLADELRHFARATRPEWPDEAERASDLASHVAPGGPLRSVRRPVGR